MDDQWVTVEVERENSVAAAIEDLTDDYLAETGVDWYNDEGGYGELEIDVDAGTVSLNVNVRWTDSECEYFSERDIMTGEVVD